MKHGQIMKVKKKLTITQAPRGIAGVLATTKMKTTGEIGVIGKARANLGTEATPASNPPRAPGTARPGPGPNIAGQMQSAAPC